MLIVGIVGAKQPHQHCLEACFLALHRVAHDRPISEYMVKGVTGSVREKSISRDGHSRLR